MSENPCSGRRAEGRRDPLPAARFHKAIPIGVIPSRRFTAGRSTSRTGFIGTTSNLTKCAKRLDSAARRRRTVEAFVLDYDGDLCGEHVGIEFVARLRAMAAFDRVDDLLAAMAGDVERTREILRSA